MLVAMLMVVIVDVVMIVVMFMVMVVFIVMMVVMIVMVLMVMRMRGHLRVMAVQLRIHIPGLFLRPMDIDMHMSSGDSALH